MQGGLRTCKERGLHTDREKNCTFWYINTPYGTIYIFPSVFHNFTTLALYNSFIKPNYSYSEATLDDSTIISFLV